MVRFGPSRLVRTGETLQFSGRLASYWPYQSSAEQPYTDYLNNTPKFVVSMALVDQIFGFPSSWGLDYYIGQFLSNAHETQHVFGVGRDGGSHAHAGTVTKAVAEGCRRRLASTPAGPQDTVARPFVRRKEEIGMFLVEKRAP